jgi:hypothetical protein
MYEGTSIVTIDDNVLPSGRLHTTRVDMWLLRNGGLLISRSNWRNSNMLHCQFVYRSDVVTRVWNRGLAVKSQFLTSWPVAQTVIKCGSAELCLESQSICTRNRFWICVQHIPSSVLVLLPTIRPDSLSGLPQCPEKCRDSNCVVICHVRLPQSPYLITSYGNVPMQLVL